MDDVTSKSSKLDRQGGGRFRESMLWRIRLPLWLMGKPVGFAPSLAIHLANVLAGAKCARKTILLWNAQ